MPHDLAAERMRSALPVALTIAGSDSSGGAGIQADLKTFAALGVYGTSALTCVTAQNLAGVTGIAALAPEMVAAQIRAVFAGAKVHAAKTGMLYSEQIIRAVAETMRALRVRSLVVDPVMVATSGAELLRKDAVDALRDTLMPLADLVTPNRPEAELLSELRIRNLAGMEEAARRIGTAYNVACVVKGGHMTGEHAVDILWDGNGLHRLTGPRYGSHKVHGTGCTFSAAITALLARGSGLREAVEQAKTFLGSHLKDCARHGRGFLERLGLGDSES